MARLSSSRRARRIRDHPESYDLRRHDWPARAPMTSSPHALCCTNRAGEVDVEKDTAPMASEDKLTPETLTIACQAASWLVRSCRCGWRCTSIGPVNVP